MKTTIDLFDNVDTLSTELQCIINKYGELDETYENCANFLIEIKPLGYTFEYGLDAIPFNLRKTKQEAKKQVTKVQTGEEIIRFIKTPEPNEKIKVYTNDNEFYFGRIQSTLFKKTIVEGMQVLKEYAVVKRTDETFELCETNFFFNSTRVVDSEDYITINNILGNVITKL